MGLYITYVHTQGFGHAYLAKIKTEPKTIKDVEELSKVITKVDETIEENEDIIILNWKELEDHENNSN